MELPRENQPDSANADLIGRQDTIAFQRQQIVESLVWPAVFVIVLWCIEGYFQGAGDRAYSMGNHPRNVDGLLGIFLSPLIHAGIDHLLANSAPLLIVGTGIWYFYRQIATRVIAMIWIFTGFWVWLMAREEYHIGASGLVYGGVVFLFFSGVLRKDVRLLAVSLLVVFLYGSLAWGVFPIDPTQSWETHLAGSLAGLFAAVYYRDRGPRRKVYQWEIEEAMEQQVGE